MLQSSHKVPERTEKSFKYRVSGQYRGKKDKQFAAEQHVVIGFPTGRSEDLADQPMTAGIPVPIIAKMVLKGLFPSRVRERVDDFFTPRPQNLDHLVVRLTGFSLPRTDPQTQEGIISTVRSYCRSSPANRWL